MSKRAPFRLIPEFSERPWGRKNLSPWYETDGTRKLGEAWLTGGACVVEDGPFAGLSLAEVVAREGAMLLGKSAELGEFPLLIKLLFPDDKLSVQVHPNDEQAAARGGKFGKTECWYVVDAEAGSSVAVGFRGEPTKQEIATSIEEGRLEELLNHIYVMPGDMVFVDAGTVHAIGPGVTLLETQQTSDITYRLYDYGRPRELHLKDGLEVLQTKTRAGKVWSKEMDGFTRLIDEKYFAVDRFELEMEDEILITDGTGQPNVIVLLEGAGRVVTDTGYVVTLERGRAVVVPASVREYSIGAHEPMVCVRAMP